MSLRAVVVIYVGLIGLCFIVVFGSVFLPIGVRDQIVPVASDGVKTLIGAVIGVVSAVVAVQGKREV